MLSSNKIGFWAVFGIVTGSQIGSGIFTLPACLAPYGGVGILGAIIAGIGAVCLAMVFALLCAKLPYTGGPHVYIKHAFGERWAFFAGWTYWLISWVSTTIVVVSSVSYLSPLLSKILINFPSLQQHQQQVYLLLELLLLFVITLVNLKGIKYAGNTEFLLTVLKLVPLVLLPIAGLHYFRLDNFMLDRGMAHFSFSSLLGKTTLLCLWGFIGLETGTAPADSVVSPAVTIPKATIIGTLSVAFLYILNLVVVMGIIPGKELIYISAPYVNLTQMIFGGNWHLLLSMIASIVCIGTLNAWVLTSGQISLGLAQDKLMPKIFQIRNQHNAPVYGILTSCIGTIPFLWLLSKQSFVAQINQILDISVIAFLFIYLGSVLSLLKILYQESTKSWCNYVTAIIALGFCGWVLYETPIKTVLLSSLFVTSAIPMYLIKQYYGKKF